MVVRGRMDDSVAVVVLGGSGLDMPNILRRWTWAWPPPIRTRSERRGVGVGIWFIVG